MRRRVTDVGSFFTINAEIKPPYIPPKEGPQNVPLLWRG
jgi:hypothetical protein